MPSERSRGSSSGRLKCGSRRLKGDERTSATAVTPAACSNWTNRSQAWFEWPIVYNRAGVAAVPICIGLPRGSIIRTIIPLPGEGDCRGHGPGGLDADGEVLL